MLPLLTPRAVLDGEIQRILDMGVEVVGGIPHFERTCAQGTDSIRLLCELAEKNRHACVVDLGGGIVVEVPANPLAQGLRMAGRMVR